MYVFENGRAYLESGPAKAHCRDCGKAIPEMRLHYQRSRLLCGFRPIAPRTPEQYRKRPLW